MAGKSKDMERQNKALADLMSGKEYQKDYVQVGYEGKQENLGGKTRESNISKVLQSARMPWFCPTCKKTMKKKLDNKFWRTKGHCFDCQIEFENKLRMKGEFENYARGLELENRKSYVRDLKQSLEEFKGTEGKQEFFNSVGVQDIELEKEQWDMGQEKFETMVQEAKDHIDKIEKAIDEEQKELDSARADST